MIRFALLLALCFGWQTAAATAADLPSLQAGEYQPAEDSAVIPKVAQVDTGAREINLTMELDSLVANADGSKSEGSASMQGKMMVEQPDFVSLPSMLVTISGHIVKTVGSTARLDLHIGDSSRSFVWGTNEVKSGQFNFTFNEKVPGGKVPPFFPVSVIALVSKTEPGAAVLVSLEKINVKLGNFDKTAER